MTKLLEKAFKKAGNLPKVEQNALAKWLLKEMESDKKWDEIFADSENLLDQLADEALEDHQQRGTKPLSLNRL